MASHEPPAPQSAALAFGLLLCLFDHRVHAIYDPSDTCPLSACGVHIVPGIWLPGPATLCHRCLAAIPDPDDVELRPASAVRREVLAADPDGHAGPLLGLARWYLSCHYDRRIRRVLAREWRRHG